MKRFFPLFISIFPALYYVLFQFDYRFLLGICCFLIWATLEIYFETESSLNTNTGKSIDKYSRLVFLIIRHLSIWVAVCDNFFLKRNTDPIYFFQLLGFFFIFIGTSLRLISMRTLGDNFTMELVERRTQKLVKKGIYKKIRHPSYLGMIFIFSSFSIFTQSALSFCICLALLLPAVCYRIMLEEKLLQKSIGQQYLEYKKNTPAIFPKLF